MNSSGDKSYRLYPPLALLGLINFSDFQFVTFLYQFEPVLKKLFDSDNQCISSHEKSWQDEKQKESEHLSRQDEKERESVHLSRQVE